MSVSVLIPAYNEEDRIAATVQAAKGLAGVAEVIVIDDGSTDDTVTVAAAAGGRVLRRQRNGGKAAALMSASSEVKGEYLLLLDADLGATAAEAQVLIDPVLAGDTDMTIATFPVVPGRGGGMGLVVRLSRWGILRATGKTLQAPLSGQRCLRREVFAAALPLAAGFGVETALTIDALKAGFRVLEVPTQMDHRVTQNDWPARLHRTRQLRDVARALFLRRHP